ncbi:hypothetical protein HanIR_Chr01g0031341 [Helianthus annuus]|nr:hypothetical protein HanIR_Chr01g0031341 [Helianthus annuus]
MNMVGLIEVECCKPFFAILLRFLLLQYIKVFLLKYTTGKAHSGYVCFVVL